MQKFFIVVLLSIVILISFSLIILSTLSKGPENNFFNAKYRANFAKYPLIRNILNLHSDGDARSDYLSGNKQIVLEVDEMQGLQIPQTALDLLVKNISKATGKQAKYIISNSDIPFTGSVDDKQIDEIAKKYGNFSNTSTESVLYVLYLNEFENQDNHLGSTYRDDGVLLFAKPLQDFSQNFPQAFADNVESTALHEFGHQLGLAHNQVPGCLMQAYADDFDLFYGGQNGVITDFCDYELTQIKNSQK
jgi:predicted Zn-dependent protease